MDEEKLNENGVLDTGSENINSETEGCLDVAFSDGSNVLFSNDIIIDQNIRADSVSSYDAVPEEDRSVKNKIKAIINNEIQRRRRKKIWKYTLNNDDKIYRGPFGLFSLRVLAWIAIVLYQISVCLVVGSNLASKPSLAIYGAILSTFSTLSMPFFLLANFAYIIQNKEDILKTLIAYFLMMVLLAAVFYVVYLHFIVGFVAKVLKVSFTDANAVISGLLSLTIGTFKFNIFVDMFMCTLFVFFFLYTPKKHFKGTKIKFFRAFALIPILYEVTMIILRILSVDGTVVIPFLLTPFMPTKCPMIFLSFIMIVFFEGRRKKLYAKYNNNSFEDYEAYFNSNKNSWLFAKSAAKSFAITGIIDIILYAVLTFASAESANGQVVNILEFGNSASLLLAAPYILLFSYNRKFKPSKLDLFLPIIAVISIVVVYMEAIYRAAALLV